VGFPEYAYMTVRKLKVFVKGCKVGKWREVARVVTNLMEKYSEEAKKNRLKLNQTPMEVVDFEPMLAHGELPAKDRLSKLMKGRGFTAISEIVLGSETDAAPTRVQAPAIKTKKGNKESSSGAGKSNKESKVSKARKEVPLKKGKTLTGSKKKGLSQKEVKDKNGGSVKGFDVDDFFG